MFKGIEMILAKNERTHMLGERMRDEKGKGKRLKGEKVKGGKRKSENNLLSLFSFPFPLFPF
jgi:hypothetical protein